MDFKYEGGGRERERVFPVTWMELERNAWRSKKPSLDYTLPHLFWMPSFQTVDHSQGSWNILGFVGVLYRGSGEIALPRLCGASTHHAVRRWILSLSAPDNSFFWGTAFWFSRRDLIGRLWDCWVDELWCCFDCGIKCLFMCRLCPSFESGTRHRSVLFGCWQNTTCISLGYLCFVSCIWLKVWGVWCR